MTRKRTSEDVREGFDPSLHTAEITQEDLADLTKRAREDIEAARAKRDEPIHVDQYTTRGDGDVLVGHFARIERGDHRGEIGVYESTVSADRDGYPEAVVVSLRSSSQKVVVDYSDLTPVAFGGR